MRDLFGDGVASLTTARRAFVFRARSVDHWIELFREYYGPINRAFAAQDEVGQVELVADIHQLPRHYNRATDGTIVVPADYLEGIATRR